MQFLTARSWQILAAIGIATGILGCATSAEAADEVVFRYGILRQRLSVIELTKFAETGEQSPVLSKYLRMTKSEPESIRQTLNQPVNVDHKILDKALNNAAGNLLLDELGKMIQTPDDEGNQEALRTALAESTAKDNQMTLLEVIQKYPRDEIHLDVKRAIKTYNRLATYQKPIQEVLDKISPLLKFLKE